MSESQVKSNKIEDESGEEQLAVLIKEAGENARRVSEKTMEEHRKRLHEAVERGKARRGAKQE